MTRKKDETKVTEDQVREEHLASVRIPAHWIYLFGVILGATALMIVLIALLDAA